MSDPTKESTPEEIERIMWAVSIPGSVVRILVRANDALRTEVGDLNERIEELTNERDGARYRLELDEGWPERIRTLTEENAVLRREVTRLNAAVANLEHQLIRAEGRAAVRLAPDGEELATEGLAGAEVEGK